MAFVYIVRCNFTEPAREPAWNAWYSGPKIAQMLAQPYFRSCQRFRLASGMGRNYLALWVVDSPQALKTPQYVSQWGFAEWAPYVRDWSRDLFDAGAAPDGAFAVTRQGALRVVAFDGMSEDEARAARGAVATADPDVMWLSVVGLDRHTPVIGVRPLADVAPMPSSADGGDKRIQRAVYRPISDYCRAPLTAA